MLKILVVDDEAPARARLRRMLEKLPGCEVAGESASGDQALKDIERLHPDAVLLDISMPGLDGMSLARVLRRQATAPAVIFCTAWPGQALDAFDSGAVDYLVKPVRAERLQAALDRAVRFVGVAEAERAFVSATVGNRTVLIDLDDVACLLAEDKYTTVLHDGGKALVNDSLVDLERAHGERLLRVHRNALVSRARIRGLQRQDDGAVRVILRDCDERPVISRRCLPSVRRVVKALT